MTNLKYDMNAYFTKDPIQVETNHSFRVIADHLRAVIFAIADGASPSNNGRGSIIRKLIRRIMVCSRKIGIKNIFKSELIDTVIKTVEDFYSYLNNEKEKVLSILIKEENNFAITLEKGYKLFENIISKNAVLDAETAFKLVDTYGFPFDIIKDLAEQKNIKIDETGFEAKFKKHQEISRANLEIKGMASQAPGLINFTKEANFEYYKDNIKDAQIIGIFDENFDPISTSNTKC
jgi:alanyl-tRNA synthetase